jgi:hypothetical protein
MTLRIDESDIAIAREATKAILLGIITAAGVVRLVEADPIHFPGHVEWLSKCRITDAIRGFSLLVRGGRVWAVFPRSRINPGPDARLEDEYAAQLLALLPKEDNPQVLE